ncbi:nucleotidyl transferase AbiEii/AbiGii toxin family protein [Cellvibrio sp. NN19]|uniref:nucleotidyl transferase AbiEii/AbiGii toxin family protein n=1 Tax=Cellvibrio chitinivorans TaxID=3102792 RepID=UPI002B40954B|nr:nucleotidyl transferase AbiEii/AbiGii toxin family protein [Cellvibrio sp. NN19]
MNIFDFYKDSAKHNELGEIFTLGAQRHQYGLASNFLEKDIWVTEVLRLLFDEGLLGNYSTAFKGGTALSKCWNAIQRFSEDIDLSIHWADLAEAEDEAQAWEKSNSTPSQQKKFRDKQSKLLAQWSEFFVNRLNNRFATYGIEGLVAELDLDSKGEKINIRYPRLAKDINNYQLDYILLEFGGRNRGRPTITKQVDTYLSEVSEFAALNLPTAKVQAYDPAYILWEKLTALHQFCTQTAEPNPTRLSRHWYDVDCLLQQNFADPIQSRQAMQDVIEMKSNRWAVAGVDYGQIAEGKLVLVPAEDRLAAIAEDHKEAADGGMFFYPQSDFNSIIARLENAQNTINRSIIS